MTDDLTRLRAGALDDRRQRLTAVAFDPDGHDWPDAFLTREKTKRGDKGVSLKTLASALGCSSQALMHRVGEPVGVAAVAGKPVDVYDPDLLVKLREVDQIVASREKRVTGLTDRERIHELAEAFNEVGAYRLAKLRVQRFRSISDTCFDIDSLTVLVGKNGAGKSSLLDGLRAGLGDLDGTLGWSHLTFTATGVWPHDHEQARRIGAYCAIGLSDEVAAVVIPAIERLLVEATIEGGPGRWSASLTPQRYGEGQVLEPLITGGPAISTWVTDLLEIAGGFGPSGNRTVPRLAVKGPQIQVSVLGADIATLSERLYESLPAIATSRRSISALGQGFTFVTADDEDYDDDEQDETDEPVDDRLLSFVNLSWISDDQEAVQPGRATAIELTWDPDGDVEILRASLDEVDELDAILSTLIEHAESFDADEVPGLHETVRAVSSLLRLHGPAGPGSPWASRDPEDQMRILACVILVETIANRLAPDFIADAGRIVLQTPQTVDARGVDVGLIDQYGRYTPADKLSSGIARWVVLLVDFAESLAKDRWRASSWSEDDPLESDAKTAAAMAKAILDAPRPVHGTLQLMLADEPELHLHPAAQEEIALWALSIAGDTSVIVATHAPSFLQLSPAQAGLVRVSRDRSGDTVASALDGEFLQNLDALATDIGLGREKLLQLIRGLVVVEGEADEVVLRRFAQPILDRHRLALVPIGGHTRAKSFADGDLALAIGLPVAVMFDEITSEAVAHAQADRNAKVSPEVKSLVRILALKAKGLSCTPISFEAADIVAAIPEATVRRRFPKFGSWDQITDRWKRSESSTSFKNFVLDSWQVAHHDDLRTIRELAIDRRADEVLPTSISRAIKELDAWAESLALNGTEQTGA